jgi:hypothetical protein
MLSPMRAKLLKTAAFFVFSLFGFVGAKSEEADRLKSIFGVELDSQVDDQSKIGDILIEDTGASVPEWRVLISPPTPNPLFNIYFVSYNPKTGEIYEIWGQNDQFSETECKLHLADLKPQLRKKYEGLIRFEDERHFMASNGDFTVGRTLNFSCGFMQNYFLVDADKKSKHRADNKDYEPNANGL